MIGAVAVIQARLGSSRLPGKVLAELAGAPLLARMVERVRAARSLARVVLAVPETSTDEPLVRLAASLGIDCIRGSETDVLSRFMRAVDLTGAETVVRLTADCPLIDPALIDLCVQRFRESAGCEYLAFAADAYPDGLDTEVVAASALRSACAEARVPSEREHVTPFIWKQPERFRIVRIAFPGRPGNQRWTVDEPADLAFVRAVYARLYAPGSVFGWREVVALLRREPALSVLNAGIERNAGYRRSLERDVRGMAV